jgi:hypothetical protein
VLGGEGNQPPVNASYPAFAHTGFLKSFALTTRHHRQHQRTDLASPSKTKEFFFSGPDRMAGVPVREERMYAIGRHQTCSSVLLLMTWFWSVAAWVAFRER